MLLFTDWTVTDTLKNLIAHAFYLQVGGAWILLERDERIHSQFKMKYLQLVEYSSYKYWYTSNVFIKNRAAVVAKWKEVPSFERAFTRNHTQSYYIVLLICLRRLVHRPRSRRPQTVRGPQVIKAVAKTTEKTKIVKRNEHSARRTRNRSINSMIEYTLAWSRSGWARSDKSTRSPYRISPGLVGRVLWRHYQHKFLPKKVNISAKLYQVNVLILR